MMMLEGLVERLFGTLSERDTSKTQIIIILFGEINY
jgi:hypothetical protein